MSYLSPHTHNLDGPDADGSPRTETTRPWDGLAVAPNQDPELAWLATYPGEMLLGAVLGMDRPRIVCLCGSTRFVDEFNRQAKHLTEAGAIVLTIEVVTTQDRATDPQHCNPELKLRLDELHKRKIDLADGVLVLNVGGYIGDSTRSEIAYAERAGKPVSYLELAEAVAAGAE